jgi:hypothetical protein
MEACLHPALLAVLESERDALNARFTFRLRGGSKIDPQAFMSHLRDTIDPLVRSVHGVLPERVRGVVVALYDVSLDLFAASLLGPEGKLPLMERLWRELLPPAAKLLAREPQRVAGSLANALFQIATQPGTRPEEWLARLAELVPLCATVQELLDVGKILAWQSGMVQYRSAALQTAGQLPLDLVRRTLRLSAMTSTAELAAFLGQMESDPWFRGDQLPGSADRSVPLRIVSMAGAFRGFGGPFLRPPTVRCQDQRWFVSDGASHWQMFADAYGTLFHRVGSPPDAVEVSSNPPVAAKVDRDGNVLLGKREARFPHLANSSSFACDGTTLGITIPTSHHVYLLS